MKPLLLALAAAALAVALWLTLGTEASAPPMDGGPAPEATTKVEGPGADSAPTLEGLAELPTTSAPERSSVEAPAATSTGLVLSEPAEGGMLFEVVLASTGEPLPHAVVTIFGDDGAMGGVAQEMMMAGAGIDAVMDRFGTHYRCDDKGQVRVAVEAPESFLRGRGELDGRRYLGMLEGRDGANRIEVSPEAGFLVQVLDAAGDAVPGAGVELVVVSRFGDQSMRMPINATSTGRDGSAFLSNTIQQIPDAAKNMVDDDSSVLVALAGFFRTTPEVEVDWQADEPDEVVLRQPPVGRVDVTVSQADGSELPRGMLVLSQVGGGAGANNMLGRGPVDGLMRPVASLGSDDGPQTSARVSFEAVERGVEFELRFLTESDDEPELLPGQQLALDQERLAIDFVLEASVPRIAARVLLPDGTPLAQADLLIGSVPYYQQGRFELKARVATDELGRFEALAPWLDVGDLELHYAPEDGQLLTVDLEGLGATGGALVDLGDLRLAGLEVLVAGRVVDRDGKGVVTALSLQEPYDLPALAVRASASTAAAGGSAAVPVDGGQAHRTPQRWGALSKADGSFEFLGRSDAGSLTLECSSMEYVADGELLVAPGDLDVEYVLQRAARFRFDLAGQPEALARAVFLHIPTFDAGSSMYSAARGESPALSPGTHDFTLRLGMGEQDVLYTGSVQLAAGEKKDLGSLVLEREVLHYEVFVTTVEELDLDDLEVRGMALVDDGNGGTREVPMSRGSQRKDGTFDLFSLRPLTSLDVYHKYSLQSFAATVGENHLTFNPPEPKAVPMGAAATRALEELGYL
ncbi:MAG: hypothetical protein P1V81_04125 [Planctomycetota bacterium]|nr:hypothetical protein [Planctomycetota bacterium]